LELNKYMKDFLKSVFGSKVSPIIATAIITLSAGTVGIGSFILNQSSFYPVAHFPSVVRMRGQVLGATTSSPVSVINITPDASTVGTIVTITGSGFTPSGNYIVGGGLAWADASSSDGSTLTFTIPTSAGAYCPPPANGGEWACSALMALISPGNYPLMVINSNGNSNLFSFTVDPGTSSVGPISPYPIPPIPGPVPNPIPVPINSGNLVNINGTIYYQTPNGYYGFPSFRVLKSWGYYQLPASSYLGTVPYRNPNCETILQQLNGNCGGSNGTFTITSPAGGEQWALGSAHYITWSGLGSANSDLQISLRSVNSVAVIIYNIVSNYQANGSSGVYQWTINDPSSQILPGQYQIAITNSNGICPQNSSPNVTVACYGQTAVSNVFSITSTGATPITVTSPSSGELWMTGSQQTINWTASSSISNVNINLEQISGCAITSPPLSLSPSSLQGLSSIYGETPCANVNYTVASAVPNSGTYSWIVPANINPGTYQIIVSDEGNTGSSGNSGSFSVVSGTGSSTPVITGLSPSSGSVGSEVTISGSGFDTTKTNYINVSYGNGYSANIGPYSSPDGQTLQFTIPSTLTAECAYPESSGSGVAINNPCYTPLTVVTGDALSIFVNTVGYRGYSNSVTFTVTGSGTASPPTISGVVPNSATAGSVVTITGTGFTPTGNTIYTGSTNAAAPMYVPNVSSASGTALTFTVSINPVECPAQAYGQPNNCQVPSYAGTYPLYVSNANGTSNPLNFTLTENGSTSSAPTISSIAPSSSPVYGTITISGTNFSSANTVLIDNLAAVSNLSSSNGNSITFTVPPTLSPNCTQNMCPQIIELLEPGSHSLSVLTNGVQSNAVNVEIITGTPYSNTAPDIGLSPSSGNVGNTITIEAISGTSFAPTGNEVYIDSNLSETASSQNNGKDIYLTIPANLLAGYHTITVENAAGTSNKVSYDVVSETASPLITSISPSNGIIGTTVTLSGTNFSPETNQVIFGSTQLPATLSSNGQLLTFTIPTTVLTYLSTGVKTPLFPPGNYNVLLNSPYTSNMVVFTVNPN
jgi:hypothetical protein